jgi:hypothetical protein
LSVWFQKKNSNGRSPTRKEIYIETRTRKDGSIVNEDARGVIVRFSFIRTYFIVMVHKVFLVCPLWFAAFWFLVCTYLILIF